MNGRGEQAEPNYHKISKLQVSEVQYLDTEEGSDKILIENKSILILYFSAFRMLYPSTNHQWTNLVYFWHLSDVSQLTMKKLG